MKFSLWLVSIAALLLTGRGAFAQEQPVNPDTDTATNQTITVTGDLNRLADSLSNANQKDAWDKSQIISSALITFSITGIGLYYSHISKSKEIELQKIRNTAEIELQKNRDAVELEVAKLKTKIEQARILSTFMDPLLSEDPRKRQISIKAVSWALPEDAQVIVKAISLIDPDQDVRDTAHEALQDLLSYLVTNEYELEHLYRLYEGEKQPRETPYKRRSSLIRELRHLRSLRLIENKPHKAIGGLAQSGDLKDYVKLTPEGEKYIQDRERNGLVNPREDKNPDFWATVHQD